MTIKYIETQKSALKFTEKLVKNKQKKKENNTTFRIDFSLASYQTQNWNIPLLQGHVTYKMQFNEHEPKIEEIKRVNDMVIEQSKEANGKKSLDHMKKNLNEIIEKAVKVRSDKILFDVDNIFLLEGNLQRTIYQSPNEALLKLKLTKTKEQESTDKAKSYFADFGISESVKATVKPETIENATSSFPDFDLFAKSEEDTVLKEDIVGKHLTVKKLIDQICISPSCEAPDKCKAHKIQDRCKEHCQK